MPTPLITVEFTHLGNRYRVIVDMAANFRVERLAAPDALGGVVWAPTRATSPMLGPVVLACMRSRLLPTAGQTKTAPLKSVKGIEDPATDPPPPPKRW